MYGFERKDRQEVAVCVIRKYGGRDLKVRHSSVKFISKFFLDLQGLVLMIVQDCKEAVRTLFVSFPSNSYEYHWRVRLHSTIATPHDAWSPRLQPCLVVDAFTQENALKNCIYIPP